MKSTFLRMSVLLALIAVLATGFIGLGFDDAFFGWPGSMAMTVIGLAWFFWNERCNERDTTE